MGDLDVITLDREIQKAANETRAWFRTLRAAPERAAEENPFEGVRDVSTRSTFEALSGGKVPEPLRVPLARWVYRLCLTRIAGPNIVEVARARASETIEVEAPSPGRHSVRGLVARALADPEVVRRRALLDALAPGAAPVARAEHRLDEALIEISARLGVVDAAPLVLPVSADALGTAAQKVLSGTRDLQHACIGETSDLAALLDRTLGRDVSGQWPTRPTARWLADLFRGTPLLEGLALDLGPLPQSVGATSFVRTLARFGAAYARGAAGSGPFVLAQDPTGVHESRRGALFGALASDPVFLRHHLGLSRDGARDAGRKLAPALLTHVRATAALCQMPRPRPSARDRAEILGDAMGAPLSPAFAAILPRPRFGAGARLVGAILSCADRAELVDAFDEDWFRNPRALGWLRGQDTIPAPVHVSDEDLQRATKQLTMAFEELAH